MKPFIEKCSFILSALLPWKKEFLVWILLRLARKLLAWLLEKVEK